jgi:hypothetical protein
MNCNTLLLALALGFTHEIVLLNMFQLHISNGTLYTLYGTRNIQPPTTKNEEILAVLLRLYSFPILSTIQNK